MHEPRGTAALPARRRARLVSRVALIAGSAALAAALLGPAGPAQAASGGRATAVTVRQLITVQAPSYLATFATLRAYRVVDGHRTLVFGPWQARVGYNGVARPGRKREGDGKTPSGTYGFSFYFG
ncbi:MAG: hypothetical protein ACRDRJ_51465, partial [Streptosporangiaceae bacterium]